MTYPSSGVWRILLHISTLCHCGLISVRSSCMAASCPALSLFPYEPSFLVAHNATRSRTLVVYKIHSSDFFCASSKNLEINLFKSRTSKRVIVGSNSKPESTQWPCVSTTLYNKAHYWIQTMYSVLIVKQCRRQKKTGCIYITCRGCPPARKITRIVFLRYSNNSQCYITTIPHGKPLFKHNPRGPQAD